MVIFVRRRSDWFRKDLEIKFFYNIPWNTFLVYNEVFYSNLPESEQDYR